jgi:AraC-like DNA-binding protein
MGHAEDLKSVITAPGSYRSRLTLIDLHQVELQCGRISLPRVVNAAPSKSLCNIGFPTADNQAHVTFNGIEAPPSCISFYSPGAEYVVSASAECYWGGISLTPATLMSASQALVGYEISAPKATQLIRTAPPLMERLLKLHDAATQLAATVPDILANPEVSRAIEQELLRALIACLADSSPIKEPSHNRRAVQRRFHQVVEANQDEPLYLAEICAAIGATERTLRYACMEYLGMSPHRYLWLRRMNLVKRALTSAHPAAETVTAIANDHGFSELGRFAAAYRTLYGESPSATLKRTPGNRAR